MGLLDRLLKRRRSAPQGTPARNLAARREGSPTIEQAGGPGVGGIRDPRNSADLVQVVDLTECLRGLVPRGRPLLIHHWHSLDPASLATLDALVALHAQGTQELVGVAWDLFDEAPVGRLPEMTYRPARWSEGANVRAVVQARGLAWHQLVYNGPPEALFASLAIEPVVPQWRLLDHTGEAIDEGSGAPTLHSPPQEL